MPAPMMYDPALRQEEEAPKTWTDLLDPRWSGQIGFQNASAGTSYAFWFVMKDILPADFFEKLTAQKPRAYSSSTQIQQDIERGNLKIGGPRQHIPVCEGFARQESGQGGIP
jgi:iron(III) transport system substrate-binding protein